MAHLRITLRQRHDVLEGKKTITLNDTVEVVEAGVVLADLSHFVRRIEVIDEVAAPRIVRLEMFAGQIESETEAPRHPYDREKEDE